MNAITDKKIDLLRPVEELCYQVAHYLLGNDGMPLQQARMPLLNYF